MACMQHDQYAKPSKDYVADQSTSSNDRNCLIQPKRTKSRNLPQTTLHQRNHHIWMVASVLGVSLFALLTTLFWDIQTAKPMPLKNPQSVSLFETYAVNYKQVQEIRQRNMQKYNFSYSLHGIDRRENLSLQEYRDVYDGKWPVIITDIVPKWKAANWTPDFFNTNYPKDRVAMRAFDLATASDVTLALPLELFYKNVNKAQPQQWTYISDELFIPMRPALMKDIGDYVYLEEDFFQLFPNEIRPWNAMLLWGTAFSRSTLHIDPYNWTGTNAVLFGTKRWKLYPPVQDDFLYVMRNAKSGFPLQCYKYNSRVDAYEPHYDKYPLFRQAKSIDFDQQAGELLLIPTGWFHQAFNLEETIAVSSQMTNCNNYRIVLEEIIAVGNLRREDLPKNIDKLPPAEQVKVVMSALPRNILMEGAAVTKDVLHQMGIHPDQSPYQLPAQLDE